MLGLRKAGEQATIGYWVALVTDTRRSRNARHVEASAVASRVCADEERFDRGNGRAVTTESAWHRLSVAYARRMQEDACRSRIFHVADARDRRML